jgi:hypothetical protein
MQGQAPGHEDLEDQEVSQQGGESQVGARHAPPPLAIDLVQVLNNQNLLLAALTNVITNPRPREHSTNDKLTAFLRTKPPTFAGSYNPLDADDWLRTIKRKLEPFEHGDRDKVRLAAHQLTGTALAWCKNPEEEMALPRIAPLISAPQQLASGPSYTTPHQMGSYPHQPPPPPLKNMMPLMHGGHH